MGNERHTKPKKPSKKRKAKKANPQPGSILSLGELPVIAQLLADCLPEIPHSIIVVLQNIIRDRGECAEWFGRQQGDDEHKASNEGHRFAIEVHKNVLEILHPKSAARLRKEVKTKAAVVSSNERTASRIREHF